MSLITLSSKSKDDIIQQAPFNFKNHFAQPIIINPNSQVALLNFYHYRDDGYYRITSSNNIIAFAIGTSDQCGYHYARVVSNRYDSGSDLAVAITNALNTALVQQNYTFSVAFVAGNSQANPIVFDKFTISYDHVAAPNSKGGLWSRLENEPDNGLIIVNNDTDNNESTIQPKAGQLFTDPDSTAMMRRGELTHEGTYEVKGIAKLGNTFIISELTPCSFGLVRNSFSKLGNTNPVANFDQEFADLKIDVVTLAGGDHQIVVSSLQQRQGTTSIMSSNGKLQKERRKLTKNFINENFNNEDLMGFKISVISTNRSALVQLLKSTDGGVTYVEVPDDTGTNADGKKNVYTQTVGGTVFSGLIYNSQGVNDGSGGAAIQQRLNLIAPKYAPFIPFAGVDADRKVVTGATMDNALFRTQFATETQNFTMKCDHNAAGKLPAYSFAFVTESTQTVDGSVTSQNLNNNGLFKDPADTRGLTFKIHSDSSVAPTAGNLLGTLTLSSVTDQQGTKLLGSLSGYIGGQDLVVEFSTLPVITGEAWKLKTSGVFNHLLKDSQFTSLGLERNNNTSNHDESIHETQGELGVKVGVDLPASSTFLLNRIQQADLVTQQGKPDPTGAPSFLSGDLPSGTIGPTLGFKENVVHLLDTVLSLEGDAETTKISSDQNIHISIPELSGVKSFEGESNNTAKTIKVLPKNEFTSNDDTGSMTYSSNYEDYININNAEHLQLNELTVQVRNPDGTMAISLQPTTRATIKIREDPSVKEDKRFEMMASMISQRQDTGKDLVQGMKFVGS